MAGVVIVLLCIQCANSVVMVLFGCCGDNEVTLVMPPWLQVYCRSDGVCICPECQVIEHQGHDTVSVETEWIENKVGGQQEDEESV